jgi:hypothetical protein
VSERVVFQLNDEGLFIRGQRICGRDVVVKHSIEMGLDRDRRSITLLANDEGRQAGGVLVAEGWDVELYHPAPFRPSIW